MSDIDDKNWTLLRAVTGLIGGKWKSWPINQKEAFVKDLSDALKLHLRLKSEFPEDKDKKNRNS